jgi:hypothetical protein
MLEFVRVQWRQRPWWMNALLGVCAYMALVYVPRDVFFIPIERDQEVWFGVVLRGVWAKATEALHWAIYAAGAWGFFTMAKWMWPWAAVYVAQIAIGTMIWNLTDPRGAGCTGVALGIAFLIPAIALWRSRAAFCGTMRD